VSAIIKRKDPTVKRDTIRQVLVIVATVATIIVNILASTLPLNDVTTGDISDLFEVYFVPAGYVFSIWGLIYIGLIAYTVYQALPSQAGNPRLQRIGYPYIGSAVANIVWLFLWHYMVFPVTIVAMLALLLFLIQIYLLLGTGRTGTTPAERWLVRVPFSIYLGWITVATVANATSLLDFLGWNGFGLAPEAWAVIMLIVATIVAILMGVRHGDIAYILVIVWAFAGIAVKHSDTLVVSITAGVMAALALLSLVIGVPRARERMAA
jgi:hypothetical protein